MLNDTVLIVIMAAANEISKRNIAAMKTSFIATALKGEELTHNYKVVIYSGGAEEVEFKEISPNLYTLKVNEKDDVYHTFEKTVSAYKFLVNNIDFHYLVRLNISSFLNVRLLDKIIDGVGGEIYCNALNAILTSQNYLNRVYPRGDFYMMTKATLVPILSKCWRFIEGNGCYETLDHVDDVLFGTSIIDAYGHDFYEKLRMLRYSYFPGDTSQCEEHYDPLSLVSRVKSVPEGQNSGWTWEDNAYRKKDPFKIKKLEELSSERDYTGEIFDMGADEILKLLTQDDDKSRPILAAQYVQTTFGNIKKYLASTK